MAKWFIGRGSKVPSWFFVTIGIVNLIVGIDSIIRKECPVIYGCGKWAYGASAIFGGITLCFTGIVCIYFAIKARKN